MESLRSPYSRALDVMETGEYIYPTTRSRIIILSWIVFGWALYFLSTLVGNTENNFLRDAELESIKAYLYISNSAIFILFLLLSIWLFRIGRTIQKQKRFPPTGFPVLLKKNQQRQDGNCTSHSIICFEYFNATIIIVFLYVVWLSYDI